MNTRKQVLIMSALLLMMLLITAVYAAWYPTRAKGSVEHFDELTSERGAILFALNCRLCHGDVAQGGLLGGRLPQAPALNRPDLQGFIELNAKLTADANAATTTISVSDPAKFKGGQVILIDEERMEVEKVDGSTVHVARGIGHSEAAGHLKDATIQGLDAAALAEKVKLITNTIACGRVGTAMPAWAQVNGGTLSDEQIRQLMTLITHARWDIVEEHINLPETAQPVPGDRINVKLRQPVSASDVFIQVSDTTLFRAKDAIRIGEERLRIVSAPEPRKDASGAVIKPQPGEVRVERGIHGTVPLDHGVDEFLARFPEVAEPAINQASCGQTAREPAAAGTPETIEPFTGTSVTVVASNLAFDLREIRVAANTPVRIRLDNRDTGVQHNISVRKSATDPATAFAGSVGTTFAGPGIDDTVFTPAPAGNYVFRCDVHPTTMTGTFIVQ